jgi:hypothetical protein
MARNSNVSTLKSNSTASLDGREATHWQAITGSRVLTSLMKCNVLHNPAGRAGQDYTLIAKPAFLALGNPSRFILHLTLQHTFSI